MAKHLMPEWYQDGIDHIWYPYTQMQTMAEPVVITGAEGVYLHTEDGTKLIDGIASWWCMAHGYQHPHVIGAIKEQLDELAHVMFAGTAHKQPLVLAKRLAEFSRMERIFLTDSGSTAVETAMKIAAQYWRNQGEKRRHKFVSFANGYHGDTMGCMSLADPEKGMHKAMNDYMPRQYVLPIPHDEYSFKEFDQLLEADKHILAGCVIEPLVQGAGGFKMHAPDILAEIYRICQKHDILFIADEVMTGFYRTGMRFACFEAGITPDMMCLGKALSGGAMTIAAVGTNSRIYDGFLSDQLDKALMSGPTFMANPLSCAAANASLDLFEQSNYLEKVESIERTIYEHLMPLKNTAHIADVRVKGAIGAVELASWSWESMFALRSQAIKLGVWLRPFGGVVYIAPPLTITDDELQTLCHAVKTLVKLN